MDDLGEAFLAAMTEHAVSHAAKEAFWNFLGEHAEQTVLAMAAQRTGKLPHYRTVRRRTDDGLPPVEIEEIIEAIGQAHITKRTVSSRSHKVPEGYESVFLEARVKVIS